MLKSKHGGVIMRNIKQGLKTTESIWGYPRSDLLDNLGELGEYILDVAFGDVYSRPGLSLRDRELVTVSMLIAQGGADLQLKNHFRGAIHAGLRPEELHEIIIQSALYNGFPKAIKAEQLLQEVLKELES